MLGQGEPILKAFILCDEVRQHPSDPQMDIVGGRTICYQVTIRPTFSLPADLLGLCTLKR